MEINDVEVWAEIISLNFNYKNLLPVLFEC